MDAKLPHCADCGIRTDRAVGVGGGHVWLCASCEYRRIHPDAKRAVALPHERRPLRLQRETLFDVSAI